MTAFQNPSVKFVNINTAEFDAYKVSAIPVVADARAALEQLHEALDGYKVSTAYAAEIAELKANWDAEVERLFHLGGQGADGASAGGEGKPAQSEVIGAMWEAAGERDVLVSAAGSHPGDLHKLWRTRSPNGYHMEYGYSCMGYEIPGAMGAKMADPSREVFAFIGDGTYLMAPTEIATSVQEGVKIIIVLVDNGGFASIGSLSRSLGQGGFGTSYRARNEKSGQLDGEPLSVDFVANARSLGAHAIKAATLDELRNALAEAKAADRTTVIVVETDVTASVPGYDSWWDVAVAEVSEMESVREARVRYEEARKRERYSL
jgi:3D-(3,5/4)-trihydroxycyclohexane-1,2-dione acylhydrolase (decyclizing)